MTAAALVLALGLVAGMHRAAAQSAPPGAAQQQAPFSPFQPFPSPAPSPSAAPLPAQQGRPAAERPRSRRPERGQIERRQVERGQAARRVVERHPKYHVAQSHATRRKVAERKVDRSKPSGTNQNQREFAEGKGYKRVSDLVNFPKFFPGLGIIYVKPDTLPTGPFLCFDREDRLVATVYMIPVKDIEDHKTIDAAGVTGPIDHVTFYFNPGHPGVDMPHYHFVIWHVSKQDEARVAQ
jgi:hypothetical protein